MHEMLNAKCVMNPELMLSVPTAIFKQLVISFICFLFK